MPPVELPDSWRLIVLMRIVPMRPAPLCIISAESTAEEPVRMNSPEAFSRSTSRLTASHMPGTNCHSSMRQGFSPYSIESGNRAVFPPRPEMCTACRLLWNSWRIAWRSLSYRTISDLRSEPLRMPPKTAQLGFDSTRTVVDHVHMKDSSESLTRWFGEV